MTALTAGSALGELYIDGRWTAASDGARFDVVDPATTEVIGAVADGGPDDVARAIDAAAGALEEWRATTADHRGGLLRRAADAMRRRETELAALMTAEQGKPLAESRGEVAYAASFFDWFAGEAERIYGRLVPAKRAPDRVLVTPQPVGVTAAITPWNFPAAMISRKLAPALASGCTSVVKPAEQTPLTAIAVIECLAEAGVPRGVVNMVTTSQPAEVARALFSDERVRVVSFTGSTAVGKRLIELSAGHVARLGLELGGHAPYIIFDDAHLDTAVAGVMASKFRNAGQTCVCANRVFVQRGITSEFVRRVAAATERLVVGPGDRDGIQIGALIDEAAVAKVERHVANAIAHGAHLICGGRRIDSLSPGYFFEPTVLDRISSKMLISNEETFGPVLGLQEFAHEHEAVELANGSAYGLAAYFHTRDLGRAWRVAEALEYGIVGVNEGIVSAANVPFGGVKQSGYGREGGFLGIEEYLEHKYVLFGGLDR